MDIRAIFGRTGEDMASSFLKSAGYKLLARNVRFKSGEIDIVAFDKKNNTLCFVEVKTRDNDKLSALESVTSFKQSKIRRTAEWFIKRNPKLFYETCRFDVITVIKEPNGKYSIEHLKNCF